MSYLCAQATFLKMCSLSAVVRLGDRLRWCGPQSDCARHQARSVFLLVVSTEWPLAVESGVGMIMTRVADLGFFSKEKRHAIFT